MYECTSTYTHMHTHLQHTHTTATTTLSQLVHDKVRRKTENFLLTQSLCSCSFSYCLLIISSRSTFYNQLGSTLIKWDIKKKVIERSEAGISFLECDLKNYENYLVAFLWYYIETVSGFVFLDMALWINYSTMHSAQEGSKTVSFDSDNKIIKFCD